MKLKAGLYIHVPFCEKKCEYCDFYSITRLDQTDSFVQALDKEMEIRAPDFSDYSFETIFLGGGTPSLLNENQMQQIWQSLQTHFSFALLPEVTLEANPGTLSFPKLRFLNELGFNRLSLGVQSFHDSELAFLGRIHSAAEVYESYGAARDAGFTNINIDLMTAFPGITLQSFESSLAAAVQLQPEHISCYTLIFEPGTPFYKKMRQGKLTPLAEEEEASYYRTASEVLKAHGYLHYEISNFARSEEHICRHNRIYWQHHPYLGLGPSAHSFSGNQRQANKRSLWGYVRELARGKLPIDFCETLSDEDLMFEYIFLNLRFYEGIDLAEFSNRFGIDHLKRFSDRIQHLTDNNLIVADDHHLKLTRRGWMLADSVAAYF